MSFENVLTFGKDPEKLVEADLEEETTELEELVHMSDAITGEDIEMMEMTAPETDCLDEDHFHILDQRYILQDLEGLEAVKIDDLTLGTLGQKEKDRTSLVMSLHK